MKRSKEKPSCCQVARKASEYWSATCCGVLPRCSAASAIFSPCSSVPVRKKVALAAEPVVARERVDGDGRVGVADVRLGVDVVDRRRGEEGPAHARAVARRASRARSTTIWGFALRCTSDLRHAVSTACVWSSALGSAPAARSLAATRARSQAAPISSRLLDGFLRLGAGAAVLLGPVEQRRQRGARGALEAAPPARAAAGRPPATSGGGRKTTRWQRERTVASRPASCARPARAACPEAAPRAAAAARSAPPGSATRRPRSPRPAARLRPRAGAVRTAARGSVRYARACRLRRARPRADPGDRRRGAAAVPSFRCRRARGSRARASDGRRDTPRTAAAPARCRRRRARTRARPRAARAAGRRAGRRSGAGRSRRCDAATPADRRVQPSWRAESSAQPDEARSERGRAESCRFAAGAPPAHTPRHAPDARRRARPRRALRRRLPDPRQPARLPARDLAGRGRGRRRGSARRVHRRLGPGAARVPARSLAVGRDGPDRLAHADRRHVHPRRAAAPRREPALPVDLRTPDRGSARATAASSSSTWCAGSPRRRCRSRAIRIPMRRSSARAEPSRACSAATPSRTRPAACACSGRRCGCRRRSSCWCGS